MEKQKNNKLHRQLFVSLRHHVGDSFIEKQRLLIYIYVSIGGGLLLILNLIGLSGPMGKYYFIANSINLFFITFLLLAFLRKYINLENAVIGLMSVCQLFCISEMRFITFYHFDTNPDIANCLYHLLLYPERLYPASYLWRIGNNFYSFRIFRIPPD